MPTIPLSQLHSALKQNVEDIEAAITKAIQETAIKAVGPIKKRVPVAFGELRDSVAPMDIGSTPKTSVDAPHAGAVEQGSPPHVPDFEKLLAWVKLRGMQGLTKGGRIRARYKGAEGPTTARQARRVAGLLQGHEIRGTRSAGRHSPVDAAVKVARAISKGIEEHGTRPHWMVRESLPDIGEILDLEAKKSFALISRNAGRGVTGAKSGE